MAWQPQEEGLRQIIQLLKQSQSPDTVIQRTVQQVSFSFFHIRFRGIFSKPRGRRHLTRIFAMFVNIFSHCRTPNGFHRPIAARSCHHFIMLMFALLRPADGRLFAIRQAFDNAGAARRARLHVDRRQFLVARNRSNAALYPLSETRNSRRSYSFILHTG